MAKQISGLIGVLFLIGFYICTFRVYEYQNAILFQLGKIERSDLKPGLHFKLPFVQNVRTFDLRLQTLDAEPQRFLTGEKKDVIVDSFARWRINDVVQFYKSSDGDPRRAGFLLSQKINDSLRSEFGKRTVQEVVSGDRGAIMQSVTRIANERGLDLGMEVLDVRLKRIDLPTEVSSNVYERMRSERSRVAREFRARGDKESMTIRADADRQRTVISAEAYKDAQEMRGFGDAGAAEIYAKAYNSDPEFYDFYRSLDAYKSAFNSKNDVLLLNPDTEFFKYFVKPSLIK
ncbi:MAG: protease modulator HflC [Proteobacteria bacterium]|jgi:modulator of FtsH protease HflC|nr:protease modulator HflC [Pseudomonadota bacterium]MBT5066196.1 protease modulator HflC [Pseudomonadota bacterium]MBT6193168.1 protease modulator HflC [Pseudomonadota bacterium]MBT6674653.1 protease modulator HflC [Pseudomonadota bacterium]MBT7560867.1 protease modulator HflC [Pseudomonadota bacterium]